MPLRAVLTGSILLAAMPGGAAHSDDVRDVMIVDRGGAHVWIALDAMPDGLTAETSPGLLTLGLPGFDLSRPRVITPAESGPLSALRVSPADGGARFVVEGRFDYAQAQLRQGGIWIALDGALEDAAGLDPVTSDSLTASNAQPPIEDGDDVVDISAVTVADAAAPDHQAAQASGREDAARDGAERSGSHGGRTSAQGVVGAAQPGSDDSVTQASSAEPDTARAGPDPDLQSDPEPQPRPASSTDPDVVAEPDIDNAPRPVSRQGVDAPEAGIAARPDASGPCDATAAAVQESPWDLDALTRHADCLMQIDARDNAGGLYERVLAFEPTHFRAAIGLARVREAQGRRREAAELYERAANVALSDGEALAARAAAERASEDGSPQR